MVKPIPKTFGRDNSAAEQWSTNTIQRRTEVWAGPRAGAGGLI